METRVGKTSSEFLSSEENICLATESHLRESPSKASHKNTCGYHTEGKLLLGCADIW